MMQDASLMDDTSAGTPAPCRHKAFGRALLCAANGTEVAASAGGGARITSGGGFSRLSAMPDWQKDAVAGYFTAAAAALPPAAAYNASNRAYPDVAALGRDFLVFMQGSGSLPGEKGWNFFDGTSASAPVWAGLVTLLNGERLAAGKARLGFLPPMLYAFGAATADGFTDITTGDNKCTRGNGEKDADCCKLGYTAARGWDPVTGLGTPRYEALKKYVLGLP